jgi:CubicO group peptidase (beta-lactamase class C family)
MVAAGVAIVALALSAIPATPARAVSHGPAGNSSAGAVPSGWASVEQNSPPQLIPAPSAALNAMIGSERHLLRAGTARQAGLLPQPIAKIGPDVEAGLQPHGAGQHPLYPGAVSLQAHRGVIVADVAVGYSDLYADSAPTLLPPSERVPTRLDTIYDLASLSKLFTSIVAMQLAERGQLDLTAPVVRYLPAFGTHGKAGITITNLLTHTSGLAPDPDPPLWQLPADQRVPAILDATPVAAPNTGYVYSDLNLMTLALVEQAITGTTLDTLVARQITGPLRMTSTMYNPPASLLPRIAAEEYQTVPDRGLVHGQVHDENAWALSGVAGHAGVFSDAHDLAVLAQTLLNGGSYGGVRILSKASVLGLFTNLNQAFPGNNHGYGFELYQHWYEGALATPYTAGHTGFTGTDIVIDPTTDSFSILLTNAVHPSRSWGSTNPVRRAVTDDLARSILVHPIAGRADWYSGMVDARTETLTVAVPALVGQARLDFGLWYDTEPTDPLTLQESTDGSSWTTVAFDISEGRNRYSTSGTVSGYSGHRWYAATAILPPVTGPVQLRWTYRTDSLYHGRGVYLDRLRVRDATGLRFDDSRPGDAARISAVGFGPAED